MITSISEFEQLWAYEGDATLKIMRALTDASLGQKVTPRDRDLGRMAWHIVLAIPEMMERTGLKIGGPAQDSAVPATAKAIADAYEEISRSLVERVQAGWTDQTLQVEDDMYGERWKRGATLAILVSHQAHHRGQMTVLMRQAGLKVPGVYGPAREEWPAIGMEPPAV
jgi:uncharacterized damage-inducible protein DinB